MFIAVKNYFKVQGRASRSEFWMFCLLILILSIPAYILDASTGSEIGMGMGTGILTLITIIPSFTVTVRRLHDVNRSGWWMLLYLTGIGIFVLIYWMLIKGTVGENKFGSDSLSQNAQVSDN